MEKTVEKRGSLALKEWAVLCQALAEGKQIFLLRKGGIQEKEFETKIDEFLLYPTLEHQSREEIKPEFQDLFRRYPSFDEEEYIPLSHVVKVVQDIPISSRERLDSLFSHHVWSSSYIEKRWNYKPEKPLHLLILRVYRLSKGRLHDFESRYAGCTSWVELSETIPTEKAEPVLTDTEFQKKLAELKV
ncbi:MAG: DUF1802 family protein [Candidatus Omnitrophica bacterium]|nr:DUF1802 family protein [Candidatus Omnitrophota bacterium]